MYESENQAPNLMNKNKETFDFGHKKGSAPMKEKPIFMKSENSKPMEQNQSGGLFERGKKIIQGTLEAVTNAMKPDDKKGEMFMLGKGQSYSDESLGQVHDMFCTEKQFDWQ